MTKTFSTFALLLLAATAAVRVPAQAPGGQTPVGPVHMTFDGGKYVGDTLHLTNVVMTSKDYDLRAATVVAETTPAGGAKNQTFSKVTATGDPAKNTQVVGRFAAAQQGMTYHVRGDQAVYVPEPERAGGGRIDFTGHVVVTLDDPKSLQGPAVGNMDRATVQVGPGPNYPQVDFGAGHLDFTPLPQGK